MVFVKVKNRFQCHRKDVKLETELSDCGIVLGWLGRMCFCVVLARFFSSLGFVLSLNFIERPSHIARVD